MIKEEKFQNGHVTKESVLEYNYIPFRLIYNDKNNLNGITVNYFGGGGSSDNNQIIEYLRNNKSDTLNIFPTVTTPHEKMNDFISYINNEENLLLNKNNYLIKGYSSTAREALQLSMDVARSFDVENVVTLMVEPAADKTIKLQAEDLELIKSKDITIIHISGNNMTEDIKRYVNNGLPIIDIKPTFYVLNNNGEKIAQKDWMFNHGVNNTLLGEIGYTSIINGDFDFNNLPTSYYYSRYGQTYYIEYEITEYDGYGNTRIISEDYLNSLLQMDFSEYQIKSDNAYLAGELTQINKAIKASNFNETTDFYSSTTLVPSEEPIIIQKLIKSGEQLFNMISEEITNVGEVGNEFEEVDYSLKIMTENLNNLFKKLDVRSKYDKSN